MGKGGGSPQPTQTTAYQTNLPEYAKPYVENMLNAAQKQVYNDDMTSFRPYTPYSKDPTDYFAGPSSLQRSTYGEASNMQSPGQFGLATGMGGLAGLGQMGAGQRFAQQATNPYAVQSYMSPYMQNVVDEQKTSALRDFQIAQPMRQAQQTRQGAFGGSRGAIENAEAQKNLMSQLQSIQATGTQKAFEDAQRQQQFGANLGLQGLAGASQTAGMLGQLGGAQQQADIARMGLQNQLGGQQQQYQQNIINQQVQDYATQQQYPMLQLANMSNLLRGLPMQSGTTQMYQAAPSPISQLGGLAATGLGVYGASGGFRAAQGGEVKSYAEGGEVASYAPGGVVGGVEAQLMQMDIPQLTQVARTSPSVSIRQKAAEIIAEKQAAAQTKRSMGLEGAPAGNLDDLGMAGGGIVAFSGEDGSLVDEEKRKEYEKYGAPGSLKRKFKSIADYYASPTTSGGVGRNITNTINAAAPITLGAGVTGGQFIPKTGGVITNAADTIRKLIGIQGGVSAVTSGSGVPTGDGRVPVAPPDSDPAAPGPGAPAPAAPGGSGGNPEGKYESEIEAMMADLKKGLGEGRSQKDLDDLREQMKGNREQNLYMALIEGGAKAMQSTSPNALAGLGAGIEAGAKSYGRGMEAERADKKLLIAQQSALEQVEYARKSGNLNALIQAQARLDAIKMQRENLGASKETAILSAREKARGDMIQRLMYQNSMDEDTATGIANRAYPSTIGTATSASQGRTQLTADQQKLLNKYK
jgi:hypothetical protein